VAVKVAVEKIFGAVKDLLGGVISSESGREGLPGSGNPVPSWKLHAVIAVAAGGGVTVVANSTAVVGSKQHSSPLPRRPL